MRVTARLEADTVAQLEFLVTRLGLSTSEVVRQGIAALFRENGAPDFSHPMPFFSKHIAAYDLGDTQLSTNYKKLLLEDLNVKFPRSDAESTPASLPSATGRIRLKREIRPRQRQQQETA